MGTFTDQQNKQALAYAETTAPLIAEICKPLFTYFNFTAFVYMKLLPNGKMIQLASDPAWSRIYFENEFYNEDDRFRRFRMSLLENEVKSSILTGEPQGNHCSRIYDFGAWHAYTLYRRTHHTIEGWSFSTTRDNYQILNLYLNTRHLLAHFIQYFNGKAKEIIDVSHKERLITLNYEEKPYDNPEDTIQKYLKTIQISHLPISIMGKNIGLTTQELICLKYLAQGLSMKEIAKFMKISPRTVENFLNRVKNKTKYYKKIDLIYFFNEIVKEWISFPLTVDK
mgnify:CR=1 FL=1